MSFRYTRPDSFPPIVKNLIIINALVWIAQKAVVNLTYGIALWPIGHENFRPYQVATHMFAHSPDMIFHILFNMFGLYMFGRVLENVWGPKRFLFFYLACGVGAAVVHLIVQYYMGTSSFAVGASGAVMGIFAAFAFLFPNTELYIMFIPIPVKAKWAVLGMAAYSIFGGVGSFAGDNVAHFAHLGGALT
ncbi:MAG: rhomboid family intramembrane serine protease, partial [Flavisolibacter sp.]|nr:rhomboid family intramembrane serine protease [Flavisolibacter sp.]